MKIKLIKDLWVDTEVPQNDLRAQTQKAFADYTSGTNPEYMFHDKLCFIDTVVERLHMADEDKDIEDMVIGQVKYELREQGCLPENDEVFGYAGLIQAYRTGKAQHSMYSHTYGNDHYVSEKCMQILCTVIKAVMDYE